MPKEIEHKFLVRDDSWRSEATRSVDYRQGYLANNDRCSVRVRESGSKGRLTIKSAQPGVQRQEFEYEIPLSEARALLDGMCERPLIEKVRHFVKHAGKTWEVDEFCGDNDGLVVAEVELSAVGETFERPDWVSEEVSDDPRYYNVNLVKTPYNTW
ncbi:MAG: CYTH domain-containing protein [Gammaproteobacteria bacterium]|jgi:adenylate cyclase|nr:CYTH domain-containing protein [Gammaproteobacteria bacterium]